MNNRELLTVRDLAVDYAIPESSQRVFRQQKDSSRRTGSVDVWYIAGSIWRRGCQREQKMLATAPTAPVLAASRHIRSHDCGTCPPMRG